MCYKLEDIQQSFEDYYKDLYSQPETADTLKIEPFLKSLDLPSIGDQQNKMLTSEITIVELDKAISRLKANKAPGSDGFISEWYKTLKPELAPLLLKCFNYTLKEGQTPKSWREAVITIIHKEGKDKGECSSYRPISILNTDYKLFASVMAKRVEHIVSEMIDPDQTGFASERQTQDNIRRTLHVVDYVIKENISASLISLDAEKAFDSVGWGYLYQVLERFGFNKISVQCISLYTRPLQPE